MNPIRAWLIYLILVLAGGATVAPGLWHGVHQLWPDSRIAAQPFHRYVHRSLLVLAVVGLWPMGRMTHFSLRLGIGRGSFPLERFRLGWLTGFASLGVIAIGAILFGQRHVQLPDSAVIGLIDLLKALATALGVGLVEEILFRGALFTSLRRTHGWLLAAGWSSAIYALVHFFQKTPEPPVVTIWSGWTVLGQMLGGFWDWSALVPGFFNLFLVGWLLAEARERTGGLIAPIGMHSAWIFWLRFYAIFTVSGPQAMTWVWGSSKMIDGWMAFLALTATLLVVRRQLVGKHKH